MLLVIGLYLYTMTYYLLLAADILLLAYVTVTNGKESDFNKVIILFI
ncbi:hypothetical protein [Alkalicoccus daliensis]|nr:hypothetical protein [Alkalicoccus daliensis]